MVRPSIVLLVVYYIMLQNGAIPEGILNQK